MRLTKLEVQMGHVQAHLEKLSAVPADIASIKASMVTKTELSSLLNRHFMAICAAVSVIVAVVGFIFHYVAR